MLNERTAIIDRDIFGARNSVYINPDAGTVEICLEDWYGRRSLDEASAGIDDLIALLQTAKGEIARIQGKAACCEPAPVSPVPAGAASKPQKRRTLLDQVQEMARAHYGDRATAEYDKRHGYRVVHQNGSVMMQNFSIAKRFFEQWDERGIPNYAMLRY